MISKIIRYKGIPKGKLLLDDEDADILAKAWRFDFCNRWRAKKSNEYFRMIRSANKTELAAGSVKSIKIHAEVWVKYNGLIPFGYEVDHLDHNTLNNQKSNLALKTKTENAKRLRKRGTTAPVPLEQGL